jgi:PPOX class probable F420-dependent enzyme
LWGGIAVRGLPTKSGDPGLFRGRRRGPDNVFDNPIRREISLRIAWAFRDGRAIFAAHPAFRNACRRLCASATTPCIELLMTASAGFAAFHGHKYLSLETFRKSGQAVRTPVWFAADPSVSLESGAAKIFIYTIGDTAKVKRMRNNPRVQIAPCDMRGKILGPWVEARGQFLTGEEAASGMRLLDKKYFPLKQLLGLFALLSRRERIVIALQPA